MNALCNCLKNNFKTNETIPSELANMLLLKIIALNRHNMANPDDFKTWDMESQIKSIRVFFEYEINKKRTDIELSKPDIKYLNAMVNYELAHIDKNISLYSGYNRVKRNIKVIESILERVQDCNNSDDQESIIRNSILIIIENQTHCIQYLGSLVTRRIN